MKKTTPTYYIYHIHNRKIGCSINPNQRAKTQLKENETYEIIYETDDIKLVSLLEQTLQMMYGYKVDNCPYYVEAKRIGKKHTQEAKDKIGDTHRGKIVSQDTKDKMSQSAKGRTGWNKGLKHSEETKKKMSKSRRAQKGSNNQKEITIQEITYPSLSEASRQLGVSTYFVQKLIS